MTCNGVSVITCTFKPHCLDIILENYKRQDFSNKELILIINNNSIDIELWKEKTRMCDDVIVFMTDESATLGESLNFGIMQARFDYISKFDDDDYYGPNYLKNVYYAFEKLKADIVGKSNIFVYFNETETLTTHKRGIANSFTNKFIAGATISCRKEIFDRVKFKHIPTGTDRAFVNECLDNGYKIYSTDIYDYSCIRYGNVENHTWKIEDEAFMKWCKIIGKFKWSDIYSIINKEILLDETNRRKQIES